MIEVLVEVGSDAARFCVAVRAEGIRRDVDVREVVAWGVCGSNGRYG